MYEEKRENKSERRELKNKKNFLTFLKASKINI
jgi:hypothetical protein